MRVVVTGASGFLGWHTRVRLMALTAHEVVPVTRQSWGELPRLVATADAVLHVAGVNRGPAAEVEGTNAALAEDVARAVRAAGRPLPVVYADSIHAGSDSPYGVGKQRAADVLRAVAVSSGGTFSDVRLPNLFGEHGRPRYNSFVATFVEHAVAGTSPQVDDRLVPLLHVQDAAGALLAALETTGASAPQHPLGEDRSVADVWRSLLALRDVYATGEIPLLRTRFERDLFNTLRAAMFTDRFPMPLTPRSDHRGWLVETVRAHGGEGQTFVSMTEPGAVRGEHFHLHKLERFVVLSGTARIEVRRALTDDVLSFEVSGESPCAVDMPTMWTHNITNVGDRELVTLFFTNELFDAASPDTYADPVRRAHALVEVGS